MHRPEEPADAKRRASLRDKFAHLPASSPRPPPRAALAPQSLDSYEGAALARARSRAAGISPWTFLMATAASTTVASVLTVLIALGVLNQERFGVGTHDAQPAAPAPALPLVPMAPGPVQAPATLRQISLRPIGSPDQPLRLEPRRAAPLPLQIEPEQGAGEPFILALAGAPAGTILSGASQISSDTWLLPSGAAGGIRIAVPEWSASVFEVAVVLRRTNGAVAAKTTAWIAVPPPAAASAPADETAARDLTRDLLVQAGRLIARGEIVAARALYQRATELGSAPAALALGTTYDPNRLWSLGVLGLAGNRERARHWYRRASELGSAEAKTRLTTLGF